MRTNTHGGTNPSFTSRRQALGAAAHCGRKAVGRFHAIAAIACAVAGSTLAAAAPTVYNNEAAFRAAAGATTTYGFESHGVAENVDLLSPLAAAQLENHFDLAYTNLNAFQIVDSAAAPGVSDGTHYLFTHSVGAAANYTLTFSSFAGSSAGITAFGLTITDFASNLTANDPPVSIAYSAGGLAGTLLTVGTGQPDFTQNFVGLIVDGADAFASITLTLNDNLSGFQDFDEVIYSQAAQIPLPGTAALLALGVVGLLRPRQRGK
jgi:hypothetical protein